MKLGGFVLGCGIFLKPVMMPQTTLYFLISQLCIFEFANRQYSYVIIDFC